MGFFDDFPGYRRMSDRRADAEAVIARLEKSGRKLAPVRIEGRDIVTTFWGKAWARNLEAYSDFESRLPRGRSYVRNGLVIDVQIDRGVVRALVSGSDLYEAKIDITPVTPARWKALVEECAGRIGSLVELLSGKLSDRVMEVLCRPGTGLFPEPREIALRCSCPDGAYLCKHLAAVLYGIGARFDREPALLFQLRGVEPQALIDAAASSTALMRRDVAGATPTLPRSKLASVFGIELAEEGAALPKVRGGGSRRKRRRR